MNVTFRELTYIECRDLIARTAVGRVAFGTPYGLRVVPVAYTVHDDAIVFRTAPYTELGRYAPGTGVAFEIDSLDQVTGTGWSVVAVGELVAVDDAEELSRIRSSADPAPWVSGLRHLYLALRWRDLSGRRLADPTSAAATTEPRP